MKKLFLKRRKAWSLYLLALLLIFGAVTWVFQLTINLTESIKVGLYAKSFGEVHRGDFVALCLPIQDQQLGLERHYLMPGTKCHGSVPLLKQVIAVPGDHVQLTMDFVAVNGKYYPYVTENKDHLGRELNHYPRGDYAQTQGYWLMGNVSPHSWDSRYWGPLPAKQILYKITPLITFAQ